LFILWGFARARTGYRPWHELEEGGAMTKKSIQRNGGGNGKAAAPAPVRTPEREDDFGPWPEQLAVRIAWLYHGLGMTQQEVASQLGMNRIRVNRLLNEARRRGIVRVTINSKLAENIELEEKLKKRYGLDRAEVVLVESDNDHVIAQVLGTAAGPIITRLAQDGMAIGVGWGLTLKNMAEALEEHPLRDASVVSLLGSLTRRSSISAYEAATQLAIKFHAECFYLSGPVLCDTRESRDMLMAQPLLKEVMDRARHADLALVSVGGAANETLAVTRVIEEEETREVRRAGAVGNFLCYYVNDKAEPIDHPVNERVIGLRPEELLRIPSRLMISGGKEKTRVLQALLERGLLTGIVTDHRAARVLLKENPKEGRS
jgi:DNA-binding transcriptional regulator LsrR (DeoR family)